MPGGDGHASPKDACTVEDLQNDLTGHGNTRGEGVFQDTVLGSHPNNIRGPATSVVTSDIHPFSTHPPRMPKFAILLSLID